MGLANTPVANPATSTATARPVTIFSERVIFVFVIASDFACRVIAVLHEKGWLPISLGRRGTRIGSSRSLNRE
jgi:hypothetical protein